MVDAINTFPILPEGALPSAVAASELTSFYWRGVEFYPHGEYKYTATRNSLNAYGLNNMYVSFGTGETASLKVSNSLHKIYHDGRNDNHFTKTELNFTIEKLEQFFGIDAECFKLRGNFEFSVNVEVNDAKRIIEQLIMFKGKLASPMLSKNKVYGKKFYSGKFSIKVYNPRLKLILEDYTLCRIEHIQDDNNLLRVEIESKADYLKNGWRIPLNNLQDLRDEDVLKMLGERLKKQTQSLIFNEKPPEMTIQEARAWYLFTNMSDFERTLYRREQKKAYYNSKKIYDRLRCKTKGIDLSKKVWDKWQYLQAN